ncbi:WAT1-related protein At5g40240 isoform X2 [Manihot esculenta]|uniref:Uncharacterized protein n=1 Tax=Manihot esculenta TaxID=3983 RepID=A0ACB7GDW9_MANES|nr:WAT1-related protein At5g40240 isoform X2 [Manihot esculenta]KAG8637979.1 hypothetical protein MANES_15G181400v8 [Manihot esculenta]
MGRSFFYKEFLAIAVMVSVECTHVAVNTLFKAASLKGIPVPPSMKLPLLLRIWVLAFIGFISQIVGTKAIEYSSPTLSSAMSNLTPAFTFALAIIFRMEKLVIRSSSTQAKMIGTFASMAGALVVVLYKGPKVLSTVSSRLSNLLDPPVGSPSSDWVIGGLLLAAQSFLCSLWYILQTHIMSICSKELLVTFIYTSFVTIISAPVCFVAERNLDAWQLRPDIALVAIVFSGICGQCFSSIVHSWGLRLKGPIYIAIFKPMSIAIAVFMGIIFLGEALHLGIIIGALIISMGIYAVCWGKANEEKLSENNGFGNLGQPPTEKVPFLLTSTEDV